MSGSLRHLLCLAFAWPVLAAGAGEPPFPLPSTLCAPTAITFADGQPVITGIRDADGGMGGHVHHLDADGRWQAPRQDLNGAHSALRLADGSWLVNDTDHHRMVRFAQLSGEGRRWIASQLAGFPLHRPHDQVLDPETGHIYVIDGERRLFRFRSLEGPAQAWHFSPDEIGYARSLSLLDGKVHIIHSSRGQVIRIDDYDERRYTVFASPRHQDGPPGSPHPDRDVPAGALSSTGLVLNDVEWFDGWYYGSNYFTGEYARGADTRPGRLIRWRDWTDFEAGRWQDLSGHIPEGLVPYYLTVHDGHLYVPSFNHEKPCQGDTIVRLPR